MPVTFDLYDGETKVQSSVSSPIIIDELTPDKDYLNYSVTYSGEIEKTPLSFKTQAAINIPVTGITMFQKTLTMKVGDIKQVTAKVIPENATNQNVNYASEDGTVLTVDIRGNITAIAPGTANMLATSEDGNFYDKTVVTVSVIA